MKPRNQAPIELFAKEWIDLIDTRARQERAEDRELEREPDEHHVPDLQHPLRSWIITEWRNAVAASHGISAAFSTGSQA